METHRAGDPAVKATNTLSVSWGLVTIPLSIYAGTCDGSKVARSEFTPDGHPVGRKAYDKLTGEDYTGDAVKRVKVADSTWVELTDEEVELVTGGVEKGRADIESFVPLAAIGREYIVSDVKQIRPTKGAEKPFVLLCETMRKAKVGALIKVTPRSVASYAVITPDGDLLHLLYADQVRPALDMPAAEITDAERTMAQQLLDMIGVDTPVLVNETGEKLTSYVQQKATTGEVITAGAADSIAPVGDSLEAMLAAAVTAAREGKEKAPAKPKAKTKKAA